jgi:hypothetical protein
MPRASDLVHPPRGDGDARGFASDGEGRLVALDEHAGALAVTAIGAVLFWAAL